MFSRIAVIYGFHGESAERLLCFNEEERCSHEARVRKARKQPSRRRRHAAATAVLNSFRHLDAEEVEAALQCASGELAQSEA